MPQREKRLVIVASVVLVAVVIIVPTVYLFHIRPKYPEISVQDESATHTYIGDFFNTSYNNSQSFGNYSATTLISEKGGGGTYHIQSSMSGRANEPPYILRGNNRSFDITLSLIVNGTLPSNLKPTGLEISVLPLTAFGPTFSDYVDSSTHQYFSLELNNVSASQGDNYANLTFLNDSISNPHANFNFSVEDKVICSGPFPFPLQYNTTYGISVTARLLGLSEPVSTTLYLFFIDIPKL